MRCAVLGDPVEHSLSPALHRSAYRALGLDWTYDAVRVPRGGLADFVTSLDDGWRGLSLTMPLKREAMPLLTSLDSWTALAGAANTLLLDVYPEVPPGGRYEDTPWPEAPRRLETTYALDEGGERRFAKQVVSLEGEDERVTLAHCREVEGTSSRNLRVIPDSEFTVPADLVLVAIGFSHPEHDGLVADLGLDLDGRGNIRAGAFATSLPGVFTAGDSRIGQSLIVNAIADGRRCARIVERYLAGSGNGAGP